jgi:hypothetical protein
MCGEEDKQVMAVVSGWAVFSLRGRARKPRSRERAFLPLLDAMVVAGGAAAMAACDPATLYVLARQRYGGLTAVKPEVLRSFCKAQAILSSHLSPDFVAYYGAKAFGMGVTAVLASEGA